MFYRSLGVIKCWTTVIVIVVNLPAYYKQLERPMIDAYKTYQYLLDDMEGDAENLENIGEYMRGMTRGFQYRNKLDAERQAFYESIRETL